MSGKARELDFHMNLDEITLHSDRNKLRVVIDNLISNAIKYSPKHGIVRVDLKGDTSSLLIDVADQGPGIDPLDRDYIFDAFYQGKSVSAGHVQGSGLGLCLARLYAELLDGKVESVDEEHGAHFRVTLPCVNALG